MVLLDTHHTLTHKSSEQYTVPGIYFVEKTRVRRNLLQQRSEMKNLEMMQSGNGDGGGNGNGNGGGGGYRSVTETGTGTEKIISAKTKEDKSSISKDTKENAEQGTKAKTNTETSWPTKNVHRPGENDVMCGRGAGTNYHPGNKKYRKMVEDRKIDYHIKYDKVRKKLIAREIVNTVRNQNPPGRFLEQNKETGKWNDVGNPKAIEKTIQTLRENGPQVRKRYLEQQKTMRGGNVVPGDCKPSELKRGQSVTRFLKTTQKAILERRKSISRAFKNTGSLLSPGESAGSSSAADSWDGDKSQANSQANSQAQQFAFGWPRVLSRPAIAKRETSNQNESYETKPSGLKKAALNRDQSAAANRLKLQSFPDYFKALRLNSPKPERSDSSVFETGNRRPDAVALQSNGVSNGMLSSDRPTPITTNNRMNTYDKIEHDLLEGFSATSMSSSLTKESATAVSLERPSPINTKNRMNTYEQFEHDQLKNCSVTSDTSMGTKESASVVLLERPSPIERSSRMNAFEQFENEQLKSCSVRSDTSALINQSPAVVSSDRPAPINSANRMTTYEQFEHDQLKSCS